MSRFLLRLAAISLSVMVLSSCGATDASYGYGYGPAYGGYYPPYSYGYGYGYGPGYLGTPFVFAPFFGFRNFHDHHHFHRGFGGPHPFPGGGFHGHGHFGGGHFGGGHPGGFGHGGFAGGHH
jgi:hypothetical protein